MYSDDQLALLYFTFYHSREDFLSLARHVRPAAYYLHPTMGIVGLVETIAMLMGRKEKLAAGLIKYRPPELAAGTLPLGKVTRVVGMSVGRIKVAGIHLRAWVEERNVTERHEERRMLYLRLPKSIAKPLLLRHTIRFADEKVAELRVGVQLILSRIETNEGHIAHSYGKVAS